MDIGTYPERIQYAPADWGQEEEVNTYRGKSYILEETAVKNLRDAVHRATSSHATEKAELTRQIETLKEQMSKDVNSRIRPLVWIPEEGVPGVEFADCVFGTYVLNEHYGIVDCLIGYGNAFSTMFGPRICDDQRDVSALKRRAQEDYEVRILAAFI